MAGMQVLLLCLKELVVYVAKLHVHLLQNCLWYTNTSLTVVSTKVNTYLIAPWIPLTASESDYFRPSAASLCPSAASSAVIILSFPTMFVAKHL